MLRILLITAGLLVLIDSLAAPVFSRQTNADAGSLESEDTRLIDGLRIRRLFDLAEAHCRAVLASDDLKTTEQATLTIELIKTQTARAILGSANERDSAWQSAMQTANEFATRYPRHPREILVRIQAALAHLAHGRLISQELAAEMSPESAKPQALDELRTARSLLEEVQRQIEKAIPDARRKSLAEGELSSEELLALNRNVRYQLAIANVTRAQLYAPDDRLNRVDALNEVLRKLAEVQRETSPGQPLWWESNILRIECLRLLGRQSEAQNELGRLSTSGSESTPVPPSLMVQQLKLALESGDQMIATAALEKVERISDRSPELDLARVELSMNLASHATGDQAQKWIADAANITRQMEVQHGAYWGRRAELILIGSSGTASRIVRNSTDPAAMNGSNSTELDLLVRLADQAMRTDRLEDAIKAYDRAAETARAIGDKRQAFSLAVRASQALEKRQLHGEAAERLIKLAEQDPTFEFASAAHLRGLWNWGQVAASAPEQLPQFMLLLNQHLKSWPDSPTANQARIWLGGQLQIQSKWESAFETYLAVTATSEFYDEALTRAVYCAGKWVATTEDSQTVMVADRITTRLNEIQSRIPADTPASYQTLLAIADFGLRHGTVKPARLVQPLSELVAHTQGESKSAGQATLIAALATAPSEAARASELLANLEGLSRYEKVWSEIDGTLSFHPDLKSADVYAIQLQVIEKALAAELPEQDQDTWLYRQSDALASLGKTQPALAVLEKLEQRRPRDAGVQLRIARLLTLENGTDSENALSRWRQLASRIKPHTPNWYEAKYNVARQLVATGKTEDARKLLEYLKAVPPGWENSDWKPEFEKLLAKCRQ